MAILMVHLYQSNYFQIEHLSAIRLHVHCGIKHRLVRTYHGDLSRAYQFKSSRRRFSGVTNNLSLPAVH